MPRTSRTIEKSYSDFKDSLKGFLTFIFDEIKHSNEQGMPVTFTEYSQDPTDPDDPMEPQFDRWIHSVLKGLLSHLFPDMLPQVFEKNKLKYESINSTKEFSAQHRFPIILKASEAVGSSSDQYGMMLDFTLMRNIRSELERKGMTNEREQIFVIQMLVFKACIELGYEVNPQQRASLNKLYGQLSSAYTLPSKVETTFKLGMKKAFDSIPINYDLSSNYPLNVSISILLVATLQVLAGIREFTGVNRDLLYNIGKPSPIRSTGYAALDTALDATVSYGFVLMFSMLMHIWAIGYKNVRENPEYVYVIEYEHAVHNRDNFIIPPDQFLIKPEQVLLEKGVEGSSSSSEPVLDVSNNQNSLFGSSSSLSSAAASAGQLNPQESNSPR